MNLRERITTALSAQLIDTRTLRVWIETNAGKFSSSEEAYNELLGTLSDIEQMPKHQQALAKYYFVAFELVDLFLNQMKGPHLTAWELQRGALYDHWTSERTTIASGAISSDHMEQALFDTLLAGYQMAQG